MTRPSPARRRGIAEPDVGTAAPTPPDADASVPPPKTGLRAGPAGAMLAVAALLALDPRGRLLLAAIAFYLSSVVVYLFAFVVAGRIWGLKPLVFGLGFLWPAVVVRWGTSLVQLNAIPVGGYVKWPGEDDDDVNDRTAAIAPPGRLRNSGDRLAYNRIHPLQRAATCVAGPLACVALAVALLGPDGLGSFVRGFGQIAGVPFRPREANLAMFRHFFSRVAAGDAVYAVGALAAKQAASNLFPLGGLVGGMGLAAVWEWASGRRPNARWAVVWGLLGLAVQLTYFGFAAVAVYALLRDWPR